MLRKIREAQEKEEGFTLIELLVVVIIIGILAAIAIPVFLSQRERAWRSAAQSDLRNAEVSMETYYTDNGDYAAAVTDLEALGYNPTVDVNMAVASSGSDQAYCLAALHLNNTSEVWYVGTGGTLSQVAADGCPTHITDNTGAAPVPATT